MSPWKLDQTKKVENTWQINGRSRKSTSAFLA